MSSKRVTLPERTSGELDASQRQVAVLEQRNRELLALHVVATAASQTLDLTTLLTQALDAVLNAVPIPELRPMGGVFLVDHMTGLMHLAVERGLDPSFAHQERCVPVGECLCGHVGRHGRTLVSLNSCHDPLHTRQWAVHEPHGHIVVPLTARSQTVGVLFLYLNPDHHPDPSYIELVTAIGQQLGMAVEQARLYGALQSTVARLEEAHSAQVAQNEQLARTNQELRVTRDLAVALQANLDLADMQERVLLLLTGELGFSQAILALADLHEQVLTGWLCRSRTGTMPGPYIPHTLRLPLHTTGGNLIRAVLARQPVLLATAQPLTADRQMNAWLDRPQYAALPLTTAGRLLGVLLVGPPGDGATLTADDLPFLVNIARQASVVIGNVQLLVERAQRLAVEEERSRIAREMHDAIAQQLYGITYTLAASITLLPEHALDVRDKLHDLLPEAQEAMAAVRRAIFDLWPEELDAERFAAELCMRDDRAATIDLEVSIDPQFDTLALPLRKQLYRIAQEALTNSLKHAAARTISVVYLVEADALSLVIQDDGTGFDQPSVGVATPAQACFGLLSMRERAQAVGGQLQIVSTAGQGTKIVVTVPHERR
ncbi:MAG: GAF domain-containing protein [Herpetosiphon sp.]